ncbi:MAG: chorismate mutase, partial [Anaerolineae bacterium]|nr:chorismate mutase [Anaerolineae bacterium]
MAEIDNPNGRNGKPQSQIYALRQQIDDINLQLLALLNQRAEIAAEIGRIKSGMATSQYDPEREGDMLEVLQQANQGPFSNDTIAALFKEIFAATLAMNSEKARSALLVERSDERPNTVIKLPDGTQIGDGSFQIISGPCAIESFE